MTNTISSTFKPPTAVDGRTSPDRWVLMGDPGVGKTTLATTFPHPLWLDVEGSLQGDARDAAVGAAAEEWAPSRYRDLDALYVWVKKQLAAKGYRTLVIDTVDVLVSFLLNEATDQNSKDKTSSEASMHDVTVPEQRDYLAVAKAMDRFLFKLRMLGIDIVLLSHVREPNPEKGETKRKIDVPPSVQKIVYAWATVVGELVIVTPKRPQNAPKDWKAEPERVLLTAPGDSRRVSKTRYAVLAPAVRNPSYEAFMGLLNRTAQTSEVSQ